MQSRFLARTLALVFTGLLGAIRLVAYVPLTDDSGVYVIKWQTSPIAMEVKLAASTNLADGNSQRSSVAAAMQIWNARLGAVQFVPQLSTPGGRSANGINEIIMESTIDGDAFPEGVLAVTLGATRADGFAEADIVFNLFYAWDSYRGGLRYGVHEIQRVAIHELGHVLGLQHPDQHGQYVTAIMNSRESNLDTLQSDDIAGGQKLYAAPGFVPANDNFAAATTVSLSEGSFQLTGSNIMATHELAEPSHADSTGEHSVWWKWTAGDNGNAVVTTFGSNFDTVLAVYTGTDLSSLSSVGSNDDEESYEQNPTAQRKRTSKVSFSAVAGTTYYFAVDGWADEESLHRGYTGSIKLNLNFVPLIPPTITTQPKGGTVRAGDGQIFSIAASGKPTPTYQWQRRAAGSEVWSDISNSPSYSGTTYSTLTVTTIFAMDGDQFRCVVTNLAGKVISEPVTLHVTPIPLPVITTQPQGGNLITNEVGQISVQATGALSYQWYHNGVLMAGKTSPSLVFLDPQAADAGDYYVLVTNPGGSTRSATATLNLLVLPVITNVSSTRQVVTAARTLKMEVSATGTGKIGFQWYHNGRQIAGATGAALDQPINGRADGGAYWVTAKDDIGTRFGAPFFVLWAPSSTEIVKWGGNTYDDTSSDRPPAGLATAVSLGLGWDAAVAVKQDGSVVAWGHTAISNTPQASKDVVSAAVAGGDIFALKADGTVVRLNGSSDLMQVPAGLKNVVAIDCGVTFVVALKTDGTVVTWPGYGTPAGLSGVVAITAGDYHALALKADGTVVGWGHYGSGGEPTGLAAFTDVVGLAGGMNHSLAVKSDGTVALCEAWSSHLGVPSGLSSVTAVASGTYHALALKTDGHVVAWGENTYGKATVPTGLGKVFSICAGGNDSLALRDTTTDAVPVVTNPPTSQTAVEGTSATFTASADGDGTLLYYQWRKDGKAISGATGTTLTLPDLQPSSAGIYDVVVTNNVGSTTSPGATLTIRPLPVVTLLSSTRQIVSTGQTFSLAVSATGTGPLSCQWYHNGRAVSGETGLSLQRSLASAADAGAYWITVTDSIGTRYASPFFVLMAHRTTNVVGWGNGFDGQTRGPASLSNAVGVSVGGEAVAAVKLDGTVQTWGYTSFVGSLPSGLNDAVSVAVGSDILLALKSDGTVVGARYASAIPSGLRNVWTIACGASFGMALKTDGTVATWRGPATTAPDWHDVVAIAAAASRALALKSDGTIVAWGEYGPDKSLNPPPLSGVVGIAAGSRHSLALQADGTVVAWGDNQSGQLNLPAGLRDVVAISAGSFHSIALKADGTAVAWGDRADGKSLVPPGLSSVFAICAGSGSSFAIRDVTGTEPPLVIQQPSSQADSFGSSVSFATQAFGTNSTPISYQWQRNGKDISGAVSSTFSVWPLKSADTGLYSVKVSDTQSVSSAPAILGLTLFFSTKIAGTATEVKSDVLHPNGNVFDQILLDGSAASFIANADLKQISRLSFIDLNDDIVQVELAGRGTVSIVLDDSSGPARPVNYDQSINYMKGHAGIVIAGADASTSLSIFSVGRANAVDQSFFRDGTNYDGFADIAYVAILSLDGKFGGLRLADTSFFATRGYTGIYAPYVQFTGPVYVGDIDAHDDAAPMFILKSASDIRITGGDLLQSNGRAVQVSGVTQLQFTDGQKSSGALLPAQPNRARLEENGTDVTAQIVSAPAP